MLWEKLQGLLSMDVGDYLKHREARQHLTVPFPAAALASTDEAPGYFQVRLCEMRLTDDRRWMTEIAPAVLFVAAYQYDGKTVRHPHFISSSKISELVQEEVKGILRIKFRNQLVFGPVPYGGGDVDLLVSLCQVPLKDWSKSVFKVIEGVMGGGEAGALGSYLKLADKLLGEVSSCLGASGIQCLLAEQQAIGEQHIPEAAHIAFIADTNPGLRKEGLAVKDDQLFQTSGEALEPFSAADYCLVKIELQAHRNDYTAMPFHQTWLSAREHMLAKKTQEAQVMMADCANQVFRSPDLTEPHKFALIRLYQAKLIALGDLLVDLTAPTALTVTRAASGAHAGGLSAAKGKDPTLKITKDFLELSIKLRPQGDAELNETDIHAFLSDAGPELVPSRVQLLKVIAEQLAVA